MKSSNQSKRPEVRTSIGAVVPGVGLVVGGGVSQEIRLTNEVDRAAELLRDTFDVAVEKRYNSSGRSGGAYIVMDHEARGMGSNSSVGISVGPNGDGGLRFHASVDAVHLHDGKLATQGGTGGFFGPYAYHEVQSVDEALAWIKAHAKVPTGGNDPART